MAYHNSVRKDPTLFDAGDSEVEKKDITIDPKFGAIESWDHVPTSEDERQMRGYYKKYVYGYPDTIESMNEYGRRLIKAGNIRDCDVDAPWLYSMVIAWIRQKLKGNLGAEECSPCVVVWYFASTASSAMRARANDKALVERFQEAFSTDSPPRWYAVGHKRPLKEKRIRRT